MANLDELSSKAKEARETSGRIRSEAIKFPGQLEDAIKEHYDHNRKYIEEQATARADFKSSGAVGREKYQDIFNPFAKERLVSEYRSQAGIPLDVATGLLEQRNAMTSGLVGRSVPLAQAASSMADTYAQSASEDFSRGMQMANYQLKVDAANRAAAGRSSGAAGQAQSRQAMLEMMKYGTDRRYPQAPEMISGQLGGMNEGQMRAMEMMGVPSSQFQPLREAQQSLAGKEAGFMGNFKQAYDDEYAHYNQPYDQYATGVLENYPDLDIGAFQGMYEDFRPKEDNLLSGYINDIGQAQSPEERQDLFNQYGAADPENYKDYGNIQDRYKEDDDWKIQIDQYSGKVYRYNAKTGEVQVQDTRGE